MYGITLAYVVVVFGSCWLNSWNTELQLVLRYVVKIHTMIQLQTLNVRYYLFLFRVYLLILLLFYESIKQKFSWIAAASNLRKLSCVKWIYIILCVFETTIWTTLQTARWLRLASALYLHSFSERVTGRYLGYRFY